MARGSGSTDSAFMGRVFKRRSSKGRSYGFIADMQIARLHATADQHQVTDAAFCALVGQAHAAQDKQGENYMDLPPRQINARGRDPQIRFLYVALGADEAGRRIAALR